MQLPTPKTPVAKCVSLGLYAQTALAQVPANPELAALSTKMGDATSALSAAQNAHAAAVVALITPRVQVRFADHSADTTVRAVQRAAETADGKKNGKIAGALFPNGVTPIVRPVGSTQCTAMRTLEGRLAAALPQWPGAAAEQAKITEERTKYEAALEARRAARMHVADLRAKRDAAKEDYLDVYAATAARVKAVFPRDRAMQDLFFDKVSDAVVADDDTLDDPDDDDPTGGGTPPATP